MIRIALVGVGHWAGKHLAALERLSARAQVTAVARRQAHVPVDSPGFRHAPIADFDEICFSKDIDAVIVCSPNHLHPIQAERALRAGKHVFCEKPLALTEADADALLQVAGQTDKVLLVGHLTRYAPVYCAVAEWLAKGLLGCPKTFYSARFQVQIHESWRLDPQKGGGAPFDLLIHDYDLMLWYVGLPATVYATGIRSAGKAPLYAAALFTHPSGAVSVIEGGFVLNEGSGLRSWQRIVCEHGYIEITPSDLNGPMMVFLEGKEPERVQVATRDIVTEAITNELTEFLDALEGRFRNRLRIEDARNAVLCADRVTRSIQTGRTMSLGKTGQGGSPVWLQAGNDDFEGVPQTDTMR